MCGRATVYTNGDEVVALRMRRTCRSYSGSYIPSPLFPMFRPQGHYLAGLAAGKTGQYERATQHLRKVGHEGGYSREHSVGRGWQLHPREAWCWPGWHGRGGSRQGGPRTL